MRRCIALLITALVSLSAVVQPAHASSSDDSRFASLANAARASAGLPAYSYAGDLADVALGQAQRMAAQHTIYHNPNLGTEVSNWQMVAENIGVGSTVDSLHDAFMSSPTHRANILSSDYTEMGVGSVVGDDGRMYVSEVFRLPAGASEAAPAPEPASAPEPERSAPPAPAAEAAPAPDPTPEPAPAPVVTAPAVPPTPVVAVAATTQPLSAPHAHPELAAAAVRPAAAAPHGGLSFAAWIAAAMALAVMGAHTFVIRNRFGSSPDLRVAARRTA